MWACARLRSALGLFAKWAPLRVVLQGELEWLAGEVGAARDADVLADITLARMTGACPTESELLPLKQAASMIARAKRRRAAAAVGSVRYSRMMLGVVAWLEGGLLVHWQVFSMMSGANLRTMWV